MVLIFALFSYLNISLNDTKLLNVADASSKDLQITITDGNLDRGSELSIGLNKVDDNQEVPPTKFTTGFNKYLWGWEFKLTASDWDYDANKGVRISIGLNANSGYEWAQIEDEYLGGAISNRFGQGVNENVVKHTKETDTIYKIAISTATIVSVSTYQIEYFDAGASSAISINDECWGGTTPPTEHKTNADTTLILPTKTGYTFDGWYTTSTCTGTKLSKLSASGYTADIKLWGKWVANYERVKINVSIVGVYEYGVVLYLVKNNNVQNQIVAKNGKPVELEQKVGQAYAILVSKPYMWTMSVSGDCALDANNKNKITYTVLTAGNEMTLTLSGGAQSSMVVI